MAKTKKLEFSIDQNIVYPKHGVGNITGIQVQEISGMSIELYVIRFERERMTLRVPTDKAVGVGMRAISDPDTMNKAFVTLKGKKDKCLFLLRRRPLSAIIISPS